MKTKKTQYMSFMALFLAIQVILVVTPLGYIPIGPISATTMHIPVIIAAILFGKKAGVQLGFVFGLTSMLNATLRPMPTSFLFTPFITIGGMSGSWLSILIAFVPRMLLGYVAGAIYQIVKRKGYNNKLCVIIASLCGAFTNTILVLLGVYFFFGHAYAQTIQVAYHTLAVVLCGIVTTNGIVEAILGAIACLLVCQALQPFMKKYTHIKTK